MDTQFVVAYDLGFRISFLQFFEQKPEGGLLRWGAGVGIAAIVILATDVTDADSM